MHQKQLQPVLAKNVDAFGSLLLGFAGAWGEMHGSSTGLDEAANLSQIRDGILEMMPQTEMATLRYVDQLRLLVNEGADASRVGMSALCVFATETNAGTFESADGYTIEEQKAFLEEYVKKNSVVMGGETCQIKNETTRSTCAVAREELARFHYSYLNAEFHLPTFNSWKADGCYDEIGKKLGYRLQLNNSNLPVSVSAGGELGLNLNLSNVGYAAPHDQRGLSIVLRDENGETTELDILKPGDENLDPREWSPERGEIDVTAAPMLPADLAPGNYEVLVALPDPAPSIKDRPEYSILLASQGVREESTGLQPVGEQPAGNSQLIE